MTASYQSLCDEARVALTSAKLRLTEEIAAYPTPVSGCDAQYNHLLAERKRIANALVALANEVFIPTPRSPDPWSGVESR